MSGEFVGLDDYMAIQRQRDREMMQAWEDMPPAQRAALEGKMRASAEHPVLMKDGAVLHETSHAEAREGLKECVGATENAVEMAEHHASFREMPDMPGSVDKPLDVIRELLADSGPEAVARWHEEQIARQNTWQLAVVLGRIVGFFLLPGNLRLRAHGLAHAARMAKRNGMGSLRDSAKACGVSVEAVRKVAWRCVELLGLPPLEAAKSDEAKAKYRSDKQTNHWRNQKCKRSMKSKAKQRKK